MTTKSFRDRIDAGRRLAARLTHYAGRADVVVAALPRGGVPVGYEVATALDVDFDILTVRKLGVPYNPEWAMGAVAAGGAVYVDERVLRVAGVAPSVLSDVLAHERRTLDERERRYRVWLPRAELAGRTVIAVDDGLATGATMHAALAALHAQAPARVIVAVPVAPAEAPARFADEADDFVCVAAPFVFHGVGQFYDDFSQTDDATVQQRLQQAARRRARG